VVVVDAATAVVVVVVVVVVVTAAAAVVVGASVGAIASQYAHCSPRMDRDGMLPSHSAVV
jgi:hypothetical protein